MKISEIMTRGVEFTQNTDSIRQVAEQMRRLDVGVIPVLSGNDVIGMITDRDITLRVVAEGRDPSTTRVGEVMSKEVFTCREDQDIEDAIRILESRKVRRLLVLDDAGRVSGIISLGDLAMGIGKDQVGEVLRSISEPSQPVGAI